MALKLFKKISGWGPQPMNTLDSDVPPASLAVSDPVDLSEDPSSQPPAKRQKTGIVNDAAAATEPVTEYTNASFQLVGPTSSTAGHRKDSHGSLASARPDWAPPPSMRSSTNTANCAGNVDEFRSMNDLTAVSNRNKRPRPYKNRSGTSAQSRPANVVDLTSTKEDADELSPPDPTKAKHPEISGEALARRFANRNDQAATASATARGAKRKGSPDRNTQPKRQRKFASPLGYDEKQGSPDPLGYDDKRPKEPEPHKPRAPVSSPNESTRGAIQPTSFRPSTKITPKKANSALMEKRKREAERITGAGLRVRRCVSGNHLFEEGTESFAKKCFLKIVGSYNILNAVDGQGDPVDCLQHCTVNGQRLIKVCVPQHGEHPIVFIFQTMDNKSNSGPKLFLEFTGTEELMNFKKWLKDVLEFDVVTEDGPQLNRKMEKAVEEAMNHRNKTRGLGAGMADVSSHLPDDLQLVQRNRQTDQRAPQNDNPKPVGPAPKGQKIKDSMKSQPQLRQEGGPVESQPSLGTKHSSPAGSSAGDRTGSVDLPDKESARSTRSRANKRSPTQSPQPPGWTEEHPEWVNDWRNSIVFPAQGKNRATVDKADVKRLDEGEFLNDNLIIFYFRYLQQRLEADSPDLAKRIYFHNTFFFEKLKPDRTGADIRFDSVKNWTSRVDLFTKDFIIVPINEHSHWYVAIICNAPKLLPSKPAPKPADGKEPATKPSPMPADPKEDQVVSPLGSDGQVTSDLRRMSLDETVEKTALETSGPSNGESQESVTLVKAPVDTDAVAGEAQPTSAAAGRKKTAKKAHTVGRKNDHNQPKIITLDSLGAPHTRACQFLRKYLVAELADKKGIHVDLPRALGMTAKNIPEQSNFCDCGLYVLGYIAKFLKNPDFFVNGLIAHEKMEWDFNPSALREEIRNLLFDLQKEQQEKEDAHKQAKAVRAKTGRSSRPQSSQSRSGNQSPAPQSLPAALQEAAVVDIESVQPENMEFEVRNSIEDTLPTASLRNGAQDVPMTQPGSHPEQHLFGTGSSTTQANDTARSTTVETDEELNDTSVSGNRASGDTPATPAKSKRRSVGKPADDSLRQSARNVAKMSPDRFVKPFTESSPYGGSADQPFDVDNTPEHGTPKHSKPTPGKQSSIQVEIFTKDLLEKRAGKINSSPYFAPPKKTPPKGGKVVSAKMVNNPIQPELIEDD